MNVRIPLRINRDLYESTSYTFWVNIYRKVLWHNIKKTWVLALKVFKLELKFFLDSYVTEQSRFASTQPFCSWSLIHDFTLLSKFFMSETNLSIFIKFLIPNLPFKTYLKLYEIKIRNRIRLLLHALRLLWSHISLPSNHHNKSHNNTFL